MVACSWFEIKAGPDRLETPHLDILTLSRAQTFNHCVHWSGLARGRERQLTTARAAKILLETEWRTSPRCVSEVTLQSLQRIVNVTFVLEYPNLGCVKITVTFEFSVSWTTLRTTKLTYLRIMDSYRYGK